MWNELVNLMTYDFSKAISLVGSSSGIVVLALAIIHYRRAKNDTIRAKAESHATAMKSSNDFTKTILGRIESLERTCGGLREEVGKLKAENSELKRKNSELLTDMTFYKDKSQQLEMSVQMLKVQSVRGRTPSE